MVEDRPKQPRNSRQRDGLGTRLTLVTQNFQGIKGDDNLDTITNIMSEQNIDIYVGQETWRHGEDKDYESLEVNGFQVFLHGTVEQDPKNKRGSGGVAIFLSKRAQTAWKEAGSPKPTLGGVVGDYAHLIGIALHFKTGKMCHKFFVVSAYHPHSGKDNDIIENFYESLDSFIANAPRGHTVLMGSDVNAALGIAKDDDDSRILGNFGVPTQKDGQCENNTFTFLHAHGLKSMNTCFEHNRYDTWTHNSWGSRHQLDHWFVQSDGIRYVTDAKRWDYGIDSDHAPVKLTLRLPGRIIRPKKVKKQKKLKWDFLSKPERRVDFTKQVDALIAESQSDSPLSLTNLISIIKEAGEKSQDEDNTRKRKDWFSENHDALFEKINSRNEAFENWSKDPKSTEKREHLRQSRRELRYLIKKCKADWQKCIAERVTDASQLNANGGDAWKAINEILAGVTGHHKKSNTMKMKKNDGTFTSGDEENAKVFGDFIFKLFNADVPVDIHSTLGLVQQRETLETLGRLPSHQEVSAAISGLKNGKANGESGISAESLKVLSVVATESIANAIIAVWKGDDDATELHEATVSCLPKKGDLSLPTNWRTICLNDIFEKVISSIITKRLLVLIKKYGIENQLGSQPGRGCQDGLFLLRSLLELRRNHNLETWALFVDLKKAFDTINHELLYGLLAKYGAPEPLIDVIRRLHDGFKLILKIGDETIEIPYGSGVKQGDVMAPVLFLFVMQAFAETAEELWEDDWQIETLEYKFQDDNKGQLKSEKHNARGFVLKLTHLLYVDDGAFAFANRQDLIKASELIYRLFEKFGLLMHIGRGETESKTKAMYFPAKLPPPTAAKNNQEVDATTPTNPPQTSPDQDPNAPDATYNVADGFISFTDSFQYLGSIISSDLKDDKEIRARIKKASSQVGALRPFFQCPHVALETKVRVYVQIPLNTVLWGCESWALTEDLKRELRTFHHRSLRRILNINMFEVEEQRIRNADVRNRADVPDILVFARRRQLRWIGKLARMPSQRLPRRLLTAWVQNPRKRGRPQFNLRNTMIETLQEALDDQVDEHGCLHGWIDTARNKNLWDDVIDTWHEAACEASRLDLL